MSKSTLQDLLKIWVDAEEHFELGHISEGVFLRTQARAIDTASRLKPLTAKEAAAQLMFAVLIWKEEVITPTTPSHIAMDKMLGHVVDFLQKDTECR